MNEVMQDDTTKDLDTSPMAPDGVSEVMPGVTAEEWEDFHLRERCLALAVPLTTSSAQTSIPYSPDRVVVNAKRFMEYVKTGE